ncbi:hypothetical protein LPLAFNJD_LOCUS1754 [Methylorubrum aminovorans]
MAAIGARTLGDLGERVARTADLRDPALAVLGFLVLFLVVRILVIGLVVVLILVIVGLVVLGILIVRVLVIRILGVRVLGIIVGLRFGLLGLGDRRRGGDGLRLDRLRLGGRVDGRVRRLGDRGDVGGLDRGRRLGLGRSFGSPYGRRVGRRVAGGRAGLQRGLGRARRGVAARLDRRGGLVALGPLLDEGGTHRLDRLRRRRVGGLALAGDRIFLGHGLRDRFLRLHRVAAAGAAGLGPAPARAAAARGTALLALAVLLLLARLGLDQREAVGHRDLVVVGVDLVEGEEAVAVAAVLDEGRLERGLHAGDLGEIDVAPQRPAVGRLEIKFLDPRALDCDDPGLLRMHRIDEHLVVGHDVLSTWRSTSFSSRSRRLVPAAPPPAYGPEGEGRVPASSPRSRRMRGGDCRQPPSGAGHRRAGG